MGERSRSLRRGARARIIAYRQPDEAAGRKLVNRNAASAGCASARRGRGLSCAGAGRYPGSLNTWPTR
jgi:hypothetical protein